MHFFILVLSICFLIFLFCLYLLTNDDFVLLRKDVSLEKVFNIASLAGVFSLLGARVLFVALHPNAKFLNPLAFLAFPYFPGLSLVGGVIGGMTAFFLLTRKDKIPKARLFDFFSISFLSPISLGYLGYFLLSKSKLLSFKPLSLIIIYLALFVVFIKFLLPRLLNGQFKEGTIGFIFLISFSIVSLVENFVDKGGGKFYLSFEDFILLIIIFVSVVFLVRRDKLLVRVKKYLEGKKI